MTSFPTPSSTQELRPAAATAPTGQTSQRPEQGLLRGGLQSESSPEMGHFGWAKAGKEGFWADEPCVKGMETETPRVSPLWRSLEC